MSRVLVINGPASGHINPTLAIVKELIKRGEQVTYFASEEFQGIVESTGATFYSYDNFLKNEDPISINRFMALVVKLLESYSIIIPLVLEHTANEKFDYMIHDSLYGCGAALGELLKLPAISSCTSFIFAENRNMYAPSLPDEAKKRTKEDSVFMRRYMALSAEVSSRFQIKRPHVNEVYFYHGLMNIVYTSAYFQPSSELLDNSYKFVGPSITDSLENRTNPNVNLDEQVIYISLGTVFNDNRSFYELCFDTFRNFKEQFVLVVGNKMDVASFTHIPNNFVVLNHVPQVEVLKRCKLFITHGGMNSVNEALVHGVPMIVIPQGADQPMVAERIVNLGAGIGLDRATLTVENLGEAVKLLLSDDTYKQNSQKIGETLREAGGYKKAVDEIFEFKKMNKIK